MTKTPPTTAPPLNENDEQQANSSNSGAEAGTQQSDTPSADTSNTAQPNSNAAPAATGDCAAVTDWATLKNCIETGTGDVTVTITDPITAVKGESIAVTRNVTLISRIPLNSDNMNPSAFQFNNGDNSGSVFTINAGGHLTIGYTTDDNAFTYAGTETAPIARRFAQVNKNGALTINGGTFQYITIQVGTSAGIDGNTDSGAVARNDGGTVTVNDGTFQHITTNAYYGGVFTQLVGSTIINNGTFSENIAVRGSVIGVRDLNRDPKIDRDGDSSIEIHGGTFSNNSSSFAGGVIMQDNENGTLKIDESVAKLEFSGNTSASSGGVLHNNGSLVVAGGVFTGNKAFGGDSQGGGALSQDKGSTIITGGSFTKNAQTFPNVQCTNDNPGDCRKYRSGGGAIRVDGGMLTIQGDVKFEGNYSRAYGWGVGGGAIYIQGILWLKNNAQGYGPTFDGNWSGIYDEQLVDGKVPNGGAGGAIFVQDGNSTAYFMGGTFKNNSSGYLGGAIYTEENSTSYIAKAVAYGNTAGHFGGGLWLCPSGSGETSKGGNIALFDNSVDRNLDPNRDNVNAADGGDGTEAGADFAIMNPYHKKHKDTSFQLMDTWFTDRTQSAVTWYHDGAPLKDASGYDDAYQQRDSKNNPSGLSIAVSKSGRRYTGKNDTEISEYADHVKTLTLGWAGKDNEGKDHDSNAFYRESGVALKAVVKGDTAEQESRKKAAKSSAAVTFTSNKARLSGGAFGTNGNVKFSTPWTASWSKVANNEQGQPDENKPLAGSQWLITSTANKTSTDSSDTAKLEAESQAKTEAGGPFEEDFYPTICATKEVNGTDGKITTEYEGFAEGKCWKEVVTSTEQADGKVQYTVTRSAIVIDNIANDKSTSKSYEYSGFDNNPNGGGFDINNIGNGTYTMTEYRAPTGYGPNTDDKGSKSYEFTVNDAQAQWKDNNNQIDITIGNKVLPGVSWNKVDADTDKSVKGATWTVTKLDNKGKPVESTKKTVADCIDAENAPCANKTNTNTEYADRDGAEGGFRIWPDESGDYQLVETIPAGYWHPQQEVIYKFNFTITNGDPKNVTQIYHGTTEVSGNRILNTQPQVEWSKVAADSHDTLLSGSVWQIRGPLAKNAQGQLEEITASNSNAQSVATVTATVEDCVRRGGQATDLCKDYSNSLTGETKQYADIDPASGKFKVLGLPMPSNDTDTYYYELKETTSPTGYLLSNTTYVFEIDRKQPTVAVPITASGTVSAGLQVQGNTNTVTKNLIPNVKIVSALPLTGGPGDWAARDWLLIGGGLAVAAAGAMALTYEWRRRKAVSL